MEQLKKKYSKIIYCFVAGMITGVLMGAATISIVASYRLDASYEKVAYLENNIKDRDAKLEKLEKSINTKRFILKDIEIILLFEGDEIDKIDIEKNIKEKYSTLLGKEIKTIDGDIVIEVVDKRIFKIEDREYKLKVNRLILTEILKIWIEVQLID